MKKILLFILLFGCYKIQAQKIEKIFVNLYTDSLKKGTYNYINIDGQLSNGKYLPLDTTKILLQCSDAKFVGNSLVIPSDFLSEKVLIKATLKSNPAIFEYFEVYVKKAEDPPLKSTAEVLDSLKKKKKKR